MTNPEFHTCPDCGYKWRNGQHGGHSCKERLIKQRDELLSVLENLHALVWGECPSLLNEDSGGNSALDMDILDAISNAKSNHEQP